jgi:hypothetical protein
VDVHASDLVGINGITRVLVVHIHQQDVHPRGHILPLWTPCIVTTVLYFVLCSSQVTINRASISKLEYTREQTYYDACMHNRSESVGYEEPFENFTVLRGPYTINHVAQHCVLYNMIDRVWCWLTWWWMGKLVLRKPILRNMIDRVWASLEIITIPHLYRPIELWSQHFDPRRHTLCVQRVTALIKAWCHATLESLAIPNNFE